MTGKRYYGYRAAALHCVVEVEDSDGMRPLPHVVKHSPTGFEWGYGGSGPADLARCILIDVLGDEALCKECRGAGVVMDPTIEETAEGPVISEVSEVRCLGCWGERFSPLVERNYQQFKFEVIAALPRDVQYGETPSEAKIHGADPLIVEVKAGAATRHLDDWTLTERGIHEWLATAPYPTRNVDA